MPKLKPSPQVAAEADRFEVSLKGVPPELHEGCWNLWVDSPSRAAAYVVRLKAAAAEPADALAATLAALPAADQAKIKALAELVGPASAAQVLRASQLTETKALAAGVAFKTAKPRQWSLDDLSAYLLAHRTRSF